MNSGGWHVPLPEEDWLRNAINTCNQELLIFPENEYWLNVLDKYKTRLAEIEKENKAENGS